MNIRIALAALALVVPTLCAQPPQQSELEPEQLARMRPDERAALEKRLGVGVLGLPEDCIALSGGRADIDNFEGSVVVLQPWSMRDAASIRSVELLHASLEGVEGVRIIALHGPEKLAVVQRVLERKPLPGIVALDENGSITGPLALDARGANVIIDQAGAVRYAGIDTAAVRALVTALLETPPTESPELTLGTLAAQLAESEKLRSAIDAAWAAGEAMKADQLMRQLWQEAPAGAADITMALLTARDTVQRPLAVSLFARHGSRSQVLAAINALDPRRDSPEIAVLVRALGGDDLEEPERLLAQFLESRDIDIRQAALYAAADSASPEIIETFIREMNNAPVASGSWSTGERDRLLSALFGVAYKLTGLRAETGREIADWLAVHRRNPAEATALAERSIAENDRPRRVAFSSDQMQTYGLFDLTVRSTTHNNQLPDEDLPRALEEAAVAAATSAEPVFGRVYLPPVRVYLADDRGFASLASNSYMGGQAEVNQLFLRIGTNREVAANMAHEWIHILHSALFDKTPRWLAEGTAESVSSTTHDLTPPALQRAGIENDVLAKGVFTTLLSWQSGASSDSREAVNYALSKAAIDFLRFGPFTAGDTRLNLLFGHISRGRGERDALEQVYGLPVRELDQAFRDWVSRP